MDSTGDLAEVKSKKNATASFFSYANSFTYNAAGGVTSMRLGNSLWESTIFNSRLQPTQIALGTMQGWTDKLKLDYTYGGSNNNGNVQTQQITVKRTGQSDLVFNQNYTYDALNRLSSAEELANGAPSWKQVYTFDRYGNRNFNRSLTTYPSFSNPNVTDPPVNPANNRLSSGYGYDGSGNVTNDAEGRTFAYDAENKQTAASGPSGTLGQYFFDGDGRRVKKVVPSTGETTVFVYDAGGKLVAEYSTNVAPVESAKVAYLTQDNLGTPRINTDLDGRVISRSDYLPYGEEIVALGGRSTTDSYAPDSVRQGFTGYINDGESGLDFAEARMYANRLGRFTSTDPIQITPVRMVDPQQFNSYVYTRNNPLAYIDPTGEDSEATDFVAFDKLSKKQQELLMGYWKTTDAKEAATKWTALTQENNSGAAAFLATTNALSKTTLDLGGGNKMNALDMVTSISDIKRDRIEGTVDKKSFDQWTEEGKGGFSIALKNGKTESGNVTFKDRSDGYGSLHDGYDRQGYTSGNTNFPRIQWNYRDKDSGIDIDLDGHKPWIIPFGIPNPKHRDNSDARQWFKKYEDKFGNPGFNVREVKKKKS